MDEMCTCIKCGKTMGPAQFYTNKDGSKTDMCKKCLTLHVDNFKPDTYLWILEKLDLPYLPTEWQAILDKAYAKDPKKVNGTSVIGKYISKMKLNQWIDPVTKKHYGWADSEYLQNRDKEMREAALARQGVVDIEGQKQLLKEKLDAGEISEAEYRTYADTETQLKEMNFFGGNVSEIGEDNAYNENNFISEADLPDPSADLTDDDKVYLAMKWGRLYKPAEWVALEQSYKEYEISFDLHNADLRRGTLQLCKLDLKMNQAIDCGDVDGYSKLSRAADALRKSLKFTEAQRKEEKTSDFSCYGQIVAFCEKNNYEKFIPMVDLKIERDIVDRDIQDMKNWTKSLIEEDPTVFKMIEEYIKKREIAAEMEKDAETLAPGEVYELSDEDLADFREHEQKQKDEDNAESGVEEE